MVYLRFSEFEVVNIGCYIINQLMIRYLLEKTLNDLLKIHKLDIIHLRLFGSKYFLYNNENNALEMFVAKSYEGAFLGYPSDSKAYKVYNKKTLCVVESVHVIFHETYHLAKKDSQDDNDDDNGEIGLTQVYADGLD